MVDDPDTDILDATYRALYEHGYANLTLEDIAAEADMSKSSISYHYDSKDQLFVAFLDDLYERFTDRVDSPEGDTLSEQLDELLQVPLTIATKPSLSEFRTAMLELKPQAPYSSTLQERSTGFDEYLIEQLRKILAAGMDEGEFDDDIEPARDAAFLATTITGAQTRHITINQPSGQLYDTRTRHIRRHLLAGGQPEVGR